MDANTFLPWLALFAGGGIATQIATIRNSRSRAREVQAAIEAAREKLGPEVDSITVQGAEKAILMMEIANKALERENARKDTEIARLNAAREADAERAARTEAVVEELREALSQARSQATSLIHQLGVVERKYNQAVAQIDSGRDDGSRPEGSSAPRQ